MMYFLFFLILKLSYARETDPSKMSKKEIDSRKHQEYMYQKDYCVKYVCPQFKSTERISCYSTCPQNRVMKYGIWWRY